MTGNGHGFPIWGNKNVLKLDNSDDCTTLSIYEKLYT